MMPVGLQSVELLSDRQKEILRLVAKHYQAKEIARLLNISEHTVKTHTDEARRRLDVPTSRQAARLLAEYEGVTALPLDEPPPAMGMPQAPAMAPVSGYEQALSPPRTIHDDQLSGTGNSLGNAGGSQQVRRHQRLGGNRTPVEQNLQPHEGAAYLAGDDSLAGGRWDEFTGRLKTLSLPQWLGLIVLVSILFPLTLGILVQAATNALSVFQTLHAAAG
jgi:DNA-binding CsgD family transcriptional regulator